MAKFCSQECKDIGSICDFCLHYRDEYENIEGKFAGEGLCDIDNSEVDACDGMACNNFECFRITKHEQCNS